MNNVIIPNNKPIKINIYGYLLCRSLKKNSQSLKSISALEEVGNLYITFKSYKFQELKRTFDFRLYKSV